MIIGIDVGGTHTDAVLIDKGKVIKKTKVPTNHDRLLSSLLDATNEIADKTIIPRLERIVLSTTISTNAIVQNKIDRVGLLVASGPGLSPESINAYPDIRFLAGSINHRGREMEPLNHAEADRVVADFLSKGIKNIGIVGKFSTRNPQHEFELRKIVGDKACHVTLGHRMSGHLNFPRRIATTFLNEAICNLYQRFAGSVADFALKQGMNIPIYILKADGGAMELARSIEFPAQTILSGPAASVMGIMATTNSRVDAIALDIGGTTTDISIFADGVPLLEPFGVTIEGRKTLIRGLRTRSIGIGGDSVVALNEGNIQIGPNREGPAAALGGQFPTPTDAMIVLGLTRIGDPQKAIHSLMPIAESLHCDMQETARMIFTETCRRIASAAFQFLNEINNKPVYTIQALLTDRKIAPHSLYVVGGPAEQMAPEIERLLETEFDVCDCKTHIPVNYEIANAIGAALARTTAELTILADTERGILTIAEDGSQVSIPANFTLADTIQVCCERLREKIRHTDDFVREPEIEVIESQEFNIVDDFCTAGKNIRVKTQVKPGSIGECK
ncbi:MAG: hydantoinase/oxoprolinase family protein [Syntrophales bacterium]|nr:hydantoinase/oxoprolinase family protein [Syntrophales bacterium]